MSEISTLDTSLSYERPPTLQELRKWEEAQRRLSRSFTLAKSSILLWQNLKMMSEFLTAHNFQLATFPTEELGELEALYLRTWNELQTIKKLVRAVEDQEYGLRYRNGDFDIIDPSQSSVDGFGFPFIPVVVGVVALAGLITRLVYCERTLTEIRSDYNDILEHSDAALCADPSSQICADWEAEKQTKKYEVQKSFSDHLKESLGSVAGKGAGYGILILIGGLAVSMLLRRR